MQINIREAKREDCPRLIELIKELAVFEKCPDEVTITLEDLEAAGFGEHPVWWAVVAECSEFPEQAGNAARIAGFALYYIRYSTWKGSRMYLEDILVTEKMRGMGIGTKLFDRLIEVAREKKFDAIVWQVLDWNEPAIRFYKKYKASISGEWLNGCLLL